MCELQIGSTYDQWTNSAIISTHEFQLELRAEKFFSRYNYSVIAKHTDAVANTQCLDENSPGVLRRLPGKIPTCAKGWLTFTTRATSD